MPWQWRRYCSKAFREVGDNFRSWDKELCEGTKYQNCLEFAEQLERRHHGTVRTDEVTFGIVEKIIRANRGKAGSRYSRMVLLAHKQGLVCDVCDQVADSLNDLTEDHIYPGTREEAKPS